MFVWMSIFSKKLKRNLYLEVQKLATHSSLKFQCHYTPQRNAEQISQPDVANIILAELNIASRTLPTPVRDALFDALFAVHVPASKNDALLVSVVTNRTSKTVFQHRNLRFELVHRERASLRRWPRRVASNVPRGDRLFESVFRGFGFPLSSHFAIDEHSDLFTPISNVRHQLIASL